MVEGVGFNAPGLPMSTPFRIEHRDWAIAAVVFAASLALRVPWRSTAPFHWDTAQFALAVQHFDVTRSQPHAPGFFLYVMLGRLVNLALHDPHASLVWVSATAGSAMAALGFLLGTVLFWRGCGLAVAVILATGPLAWFHSELALTTALDGALVTGLALACVVTIRRAGRWRDVTVVSVLLALVAANRPQTAVTASPMVLFALSRCPLPRAPRVAATAVMTAVGCVAWFVPLTAMSGGVGVYLETLSAKGRFDMHFSPWRAGWRAAGAHATFIAWSCLSGLLLAAPLGAVEWLRRWWQMPRTPQGSGRTERGEAVTLLACWVVPMLVLGVVVHTLQPGYVLAYLPALAVLCGLGLAGGSESLARRPTRAEVRRAQSPREVSGKARLAILLAVIAAFNSVVFLVPPRWASGLIGPWMMTAPALRGDGRRLEAAVGAIARDYKAERTVIMHRSEAIWWGFRQFQYQLPHFRNVMLTWDDALPGELSRMLWIGHEGRTTFQRDFELDDSQTALLVVPPGDPPAAWWPGVDFTGAKVVPETAGSVYEVTPAKVRAAWSRLWPR